MCGGKCTGTVFCLPSTLNLKTEVKLTSINISNHSISTILTALDIKKTQGQDDT